MSYSHKLFVVAAGSVFLLATLIVFQISTHHSGFKAAFDSEFLTRPDGIKAVESTYGFTLPYPPFQMDQGLMYKACADGAVDLICGYATDGRIPAYDLKIITDDKHALPPYYAAPLVRSDTLLKIPTLKPLLSKLAGRISDARMQNLNYKVDEEGIKAKDVARTFLEEESLIAGEPAPQVTDGTKLAVGGKNFTEQEILGEMLMQLIEHNLGIPVTSRLNLGGTMICFEALKAGDIDLYAEYTGTGLVNILKEDTVASPEKAFDIVKKEFKKRYNLEWLPEFGFNNTYTLTTRRSFAKKNNLTNITCLAQYIHSLKKAD
jgi:osmoprotectant transport system permease protein